jgi:hypothetical protein
MFLFRSSLEYRRIEMSIAVKPSPAANIRRLAETGLDTQDIRVLTGYSAAEIKRALSTKRPLAK